MSGESAEFSISDLQNHRADEIADFVCQLAASGQGAAASMEVRLGESIFAPLISYWSVASAEVRTSIGRGLAIYCNRRPVIECAGKSNSEIDLNILGFCSTILEDLEDQIALQFVPFLNRWLASSVEPHRRVASAALAGMGTVGSLEQLEIAASREKHDSWIMPALLQLRSEVNPDGLFGNGDRWLNQLTIDPNLASALQEAVEYCADTIGERAKCIVQSALDTYPQYSNSILHLISELPLARLEKIGRASC